MLLLYIRCDVTSACISKKAVLVTRFNILSNIDFDGMYMCNDYNTGRENVKCYVAKTLHIE